MTTFVTRVADGVLSRLAPKAEAAAGACFTDVTCYCQGYVRFFKRCYSGCGIPTHCTPCNMATRC